MKTAIQTIRESVKASGHPQTMRGHFEQNRDQLEVFLPSGESMLCQSVRTIPRNLSMFVTPDALRSPATLIQCSTAPVWFLWMDAALHGQFHSEQSAIEAAANEAPRNTMNTTPRKTHPHSEHVASLPDFPGMTLATVRHFTTAQAISVFAGHELPAKGLALVLNTPGSTFPLSRVTKLPIVKGNACRYVAEYFRRSTDAA